MKNELTLKQISEVKRQQMRILRASDKCHSNKKAYRKAGVFKQHIIRTNESRSINQPKNRFVIATPKEDRIKYKFNKHLWRIDEKPKEWARIKNLTIRKTKMLKYGKV